LAAAFAELLRRTVRMRYPPQISAPPTGSPLKSCVPLASAVWTIPVIGSILGFSPGFVVWAGSAVATLAETGIWTLYQVKEMRRSMGPIMQFLPFPVRLAVLVTVQLFFFESEIDDAFSAANTPVPHVVPTFPPLSPGKDLDGNEFDPNRPHKVWEPKTMSVIIPCREEHGFSYRTMRAVWDSTGGARKNTVLKEIIFIDDGHITKLGRHGQTASMEKRLVEWERVKYRTKVITMNKTVGPSKARNAGADVATGDILAFIDCHCAPQPRWYEQAFRLLAENDRRVVVPHLTMLNTERWTEVFDTYTHHWRSYPIWDGSLHGYEMPDSYNAVIDQAHFLISRKWFEELGGFDSDIMDQSAANLEFSVKCWLCGGEIVTAFDSRIAHMWHNAWDKKSVRRWIFTGDSMKDHGRAVHAWFGEWTTKFENYRSMDMRAHKKEKAAKGHDIDINGFNPVVGGDGEAWFGDISPMKETSDRLHCRPFVWFLHRFRHIYEGAGLLPEQIFMLREGSTHRCLRFVSHIDDYHEAFGTDIGNSDHVVTELNGYANLWHCDKTDESQYWHLSNLKSGDVGEDDCCSGIRAWNTDQCLRSASLIFTTDQCKIEGDSEWQQWYLDHKDGRLKHGDMCVGLGRDNTLQEKNCDDMANDPLFWEQVHTRMPIETEFYRREKQQRPDIWRTPDGYVERATGPCADSIFGCFALRLRYKGSCLDSEMRWNPEPGSCQEFYYVPGSPGAIRAHRPHDDGGDPCLDRLDDENINSWMIGPCHIGKTQDMVLVKQFGAIWFCNIDDPNDHDECLSKTRLGAPLMVGQP